MLEGVQPKAVISIVGQVRHEDADLFRGRKRAVRLVPLLSHPKPYSHPRYWPLTPRGGYTGTTNKLGDLELCSAKENPGLSDRLREGS